MTGHGYLSQVQSRVRSGLREDASAIVRPRDNRNGLSLYVLRRFIRGMARAMRTEL